MGDLDEVAKACIHTTEGGVPFTVLRVPEKLNPEEEGPHVRRDHYFLRTAPSVYDAVEQAAREIRAMGYPRYDARWLTGTLVFSDGVRIRPNPETVKGFNHWTVEALLTNHYGDDLTVSTERDPTHRLYWHAMMPAHQLRPSEHRLIDIVTGEEPGSIHRKPSYFTPRNAREALDGRSPTELAVVNHAGMGERQDTLLRDPEDDSWYQLTPREHTMGDRIKRRCGLHVPDFKVREKNPQIGFRHGDKVPHETKHLFYDGSMGDLFRQLYDSGAELEESVKAKYAL